MLAKIKGDPNYEELIAPWKEAMEKEGKSVPETLADRNHNRVVELMKALSR